ncbi:hypothetical protein G9A89_017855 [Geosiphon pyriformis]|nr:hypothetical protein G9A89_017855 [Geosiphon pyriformis]
MTFFLLCTVLFTSAVPVLHKFNHLQTLGKRGIIPNSAVRSGALTGKIVPARLISPILGTPATINGFPKPKFGPTTSFCECANCGKTPGSCGKLILGSPLVGPGISAGIGPLPLAGLSNLGLKTGANIGKFI